MKTSRFLNYVIKNNGCQSETLRTRKACEPAEDFLKEFGEATLLGDANLLFYPMMQVSFETRKQAEECPYAIAVGEAYDDVLDEPYYFALVPMAKAL